MVLKRGRRFEQTFYVKQESAEVHDLKKKAAQLAGACDKLKRAIATETESLFSSAVKGTHNKDSHPFDVLSRFGAFELKTDMWNSKNHKITISREEVKLKNRFLRGKGRYKGGERYKGREGLIVAQYQQDGSRVWYHFPEIKGYRLNTENAKAHRIGTLEQLTKHLKGLGAL